MTVPDGSPTNADWHPTESTLIYCFAARFMTKPGALVDETVLGPTADVSGSRLAADLLTSAFANLERRGKIAINEVEHKTQTGHSKRLEVSLVDGVDPASEPDPSIEHGFLSQVVRQLKEPSPKNIVWNWFGKDMAEPWLVPTNFELSALKGAGVVAIDFEKQGGFLGKLKGSKQIITWNREQVMPLATAAATAWADFQAWRTSSPFSVEIARQVVMGVRSRVPQPLGE
jgi:hypothetical protein